MGAGLMCVHAPVPTSAATADATAVAAVRQRIVAVGVLL